MKKHTVVVIDSSGRGAALVRKYSQSPKVGNIIAIPGNDLMQINSKIPVEVHTDLQTTSVEEIVEICTKKKTDLVDVAQDDAIEAGVVDALIEKGIVTVGPTRDAGQIEWDKAWSRDFMKKYKLPTPHYQVFNSKTKAIQFVKKNPNKKWFVKAAGLAAGKGAIPAENVNQALNAINEMATFGDAGKTFVIEEWLQGEEFSMFAVSDGKTVQIIGSAQDHKRLQTGDMGPNTGGMGCSTPPLVVTREIQKQAEDIIRKTIKGLACEGRPYKGVLYLGAIVIKEKGLPAGRQVYIIEFNARWGSPEAEVLVPGIKTDLFELGLKIANGTLKKTKIKMDGRARVVVTGALRPGAPSAKREIFGIPDVLKLKGVVLFGTRITREKNKYFVASGRLFHIVGEGKNVIEARRKADRAMSMIYIEGNNLHYRTDIGWRDVERLYA